MSDCIRILGPEDMPALQAFCLERPDTTLFLRGNSLAAGLEDRGERYQGRYAALFRDDAIHAVACHYWNGNVLLEAPEALPELVQTCVQASGRSVLGILGPWGQAVAARTALGLDDRATTFVSREELFALQLEDLCLPPALDEGKVSLRLPREDELPQLAEWSVAYVVESLGEVDTPDLRQQRHDSVRRFQDMGRHWVLEDDGRIVSTTGFNAVVPGVVQVGGVFTPPELRGRGYARCAVAGSLQQARGDEVQRSVLFTGEENHAAQAAYEAIGFARVGDYAIISFARGGDGDGDGD